MRINGEIVEVGQLEDQHGEIGVVIKSGDRFVTILGLTIPEVRGLPMLYADVLVSVSEL